MTQWENCGFSKVWSDLVLDSSQKSLGLPLAL